MPYTPPNGDNVILEFYETSYTPPAGDNIILEFAEESNNELIHTLFFMVIT
jgi:hypothetical protein